MRALDVQLSPPGSGKPGTNPKQLLAVGYSTCFMGAMKRAGAANAIAVPKDVAIDASVSLGKVDGGANFALRVVLAVSLPGLGGEEKRVQVDAAHQMCPYSRATKNNVDVRFEVI